MSREFSFGVKSLISEANLLLVSVDSPEIWRKKLRDV